MLSSTSSEIAIDTETNITKIYEDRYCLGLSFATGDGQTFYMPVGHGQGIVPTVNAPIDPFLLRGVRVPLVFHNAKFDLHVLKKLGVVIPDVKIYDTMLMAHYIDENELMYSLGYLCTKYLGVDKERQLSKVMKEHWEDIPTFAMAKYAEQDALITLELYNFLKPKFERFEELWEFDQRFMKLLQEAEEKGLPIDRGLATKELTKCKVRISELQTEIGFDPAKTSLLQKKLFGEPPDGLGLKVKSKTPGGKPQVNEKFLESTNHPICGLILEWRGLQKQSTTYYTPYLEATEKYPNIHCSFKMHGTVTGRISCADPNLQQIPRESNVKKIFAAEKGKQLWEIDFRSIEVRLAAVYAQQQNLLDAFTEERDFHGETASAIGITRQVAKIVTFLSIYGGGAEVLAAQLGCSIKLAKEIIANYKNLYRDLFSCMDKVNYSAERNGYIKYWTGRERHFRWSSEHHKAFNSLIQGGSAEIMKRSALALYDAGFDIRSIVHDSYWLMVNSENEVDEAMKVASGWTYEAFDLNFSLDKKRLN